MLISAPSGLKTEIILPASKSISNRALVIRALSGGNMPIDNVSNCDDSKVVVEALQNMPRIIDIKAAGTAMRFLTSMMATIPGEHILTGTERMRNRPIGVLVDALRSIGADIQYEEKNGFPPLCIQGKKLCGGNLCLPGNISSQYISSLLMIGPTLEHGLTLELTGEIVSRPYIDMTLTIMRQFGAKVQWISDKQIFVEPVPYTPTPCYIENDWSAASYWYEMVALTEDANANVILPGLFANSLQGDSAVAKLFTTLGVETIFKDNTVQLCKAKCTTTEFTCDLREQPDLAQTFAVTCCMLGIPFCLSGLQTLRIKETDRITALQKELGKLGYILSAGNDGTLSWNGDMTKDIAPTISIDTYEDHRMAMAFAPVALKRGTITINNPEVVSKSYPSFWDDMAKAKFKLT